MDKRRVSVNYRAARRIFGPCRRSFQAQRFCLVWSSGGSDPFNSPIGKVRKGAKRHPVKMTHYCPLSLFQ